MEMSSFNSSMRRLSEKSMVRWCGGCGGDGVVGGVNFTIQHRINTYMVGQSTPPAHDPAGSSSLNNPTLKTTPPAHHAPVGQSTPPAQDAAGSSSLNNPTLRTAPPAHHATGSHTAGSSSSRTNSTTLPALVSPWYMDNPFMAVEPILNLDQPPAPFHNMDRLSGSVVTYFLAGGLSFTACWAQNPRLSISLYIQSFLNQLAISIFIVAHTIYARRNPPLAFRLDRISFLLTIVSAYLATMPMFPPHVAIIMFVIVAIIYISAHRRA